jgi:hypothetical protein
MVEGVWRALLGLRRAVARADVESKFNAVQIQHNPPEFPRSC